MPPRGARALATSTFMIMYYCILEQRQQVITCNSLVLAGGQTKYTVVLAAEKACTL